MVTLFNPSLGPFPFWFSESKDARISAIVDASFDYDDCLNRVRQRDETAAKALVEHLHDPVMRIVRGRLSHKLCEQDVMQEVFVKMFRKLHQYKGNVPFEHWVSRIAVNTTINAMRGKRLRVELRRADLTEDEERALDHVASDHSTPSDDSAAARELLGKLLDRLSPKERLALELLDIEGHSSDEAAALSGVKAPALRARAARARRRLREHLKNLTNQESS